MMKLQTLWTVLVILLALLLQSNYKEETSLHSLPQHTVNNIKVSNNTVVTSCFPVVIAFLPSSPLVPQSSTPTQTASSDKNSDTSTTSPTHKRWNKIESKTGYR